MTYPPSGNDPYGQQPPGDQPPSYDPYAAPQPPSYPGFPQQPAYSDPTAPPPVSPAQPPAYPDPYAVQPPASGAPYGNPDPYAQQIPYGQPAAPYAYGPPPSGKNNGMAIAAISTGIPGLVLACCCAGLGLVVSAVALVLGIVAKNQIKQRGEAGDGLALTGIITGGIGIVLAIINMIAGVAMQDSYPDIFSNF